MASRIWRFSCWYLSDALAQPFFSRNFEPRRIEGEDKEIIRKSGCQGGGVGENSINARMKKSLFLTARRYGELKDINLITTWPLGSTILAISKLNYRSNCL